MKKSLYYLVPMYLLIVSILIICGFSTNRAVTVIVENAPVTDRKTVIIDAGHGGVDGGATSYSGVLESNINLEISLRLNDLMHLLGIQTVMIRQTDISIYTEGNTIAEKKVSDLKQRVKIVNDTKSALLVSIHQNYFFDEKYNGAQVFYCNNADSRKLAETLQRDLVSTLNKGSNRKAKKSTGVYLMEHVDCTGILVECGFLSNAQEEGRLLNPIYQKNLCCVIASATSRHMFCNTAA